MIHNDIANIIKHFKPTKHFNRVDTAVKKIQVAVDSLLAEQDILVSIIANRDEEILQLKEQLRKGK